MWMDEILHHLGWLKRYINSGTNHLWTGSGFLPSTVILPNETWRKSNTSMIVLISGSGNICMK